MLKVFLLKLDKKITKVIDTQEMNISCIPADVHFLCVIFLPNFNRNTFNMPRGVDVTTLKMARKPVKIQMKVQQDALGKVNRVKEINRRGKDGLRITDNKHYVRLGRPTFRPIHFVPTCFRPIHFVLS